MLLQVNSAQERVDKSNYNVYAYKCMYVCNMSVCMYVCMYVCMCVCICMHMCVCNMYVCVCMYIYDVLLLDICLKYTQKGVLGRAQKYVYVCMHEML